jgi:hypothetical protein
VKWLCLEANGEMVAEFQVAILCLLSTPSDLNLSN